MRLLSDNPLCKECQDGDECFNLEGRLRVLVDSLKDPELDTPFSVMVSGSWGTGKTSAMRWLSTALGRKHENGLHVDTCWFFPWKYQNKEDVWKGLIAEVIIATIDFENVDPRKVMKAVKQFGKFLGAGFIRIVSSIKPKVELGIAGQKAEVELDLKDAFEGITEEYAKHVTPQEAYYNAFEETFKRWIEESYGKEKRLIVFIDDLDRCMPDIALQVLEALKLYLNVENLVFVVGVDKEVIDRIVHKRYSDMFGKDLEHEETRQKAGQYLDKMFQVEVDVQPSDDLVEKFRESRLASLDWWQRIDRKNQQYFAEVLRKQSGLTPRSVVRTINAALTRVENPEDGEAVTKAVWRALIELILRERADYRDTWRVASGRTFFELWRKDVRRRRENQVIARAYLSETSVRGDHDVLQDSDSPVIDVYSAWIQQADPEEFTALHEPQFRTYWPLLTDRLLGTLAGTRLAEDELGAAQNETERDLLAFVRSEAASNRGIAEADLIDADLKKEAELLTFSDANDTMLAFIARRWPTLTSLRLHGAQVTDHGAIALAEMRELQRLDLSETSVTDAALDAIKDLPLKILQLRNTKISDLGLASLSNMTELRVLDLRNTHVTDVGLVSLNEMNKLENVLTQGSKVTEIGLQHIKVLTLRSRHTGS